AAAARRRHRLVLRHGSLDHRRRDPLPPSAQPHLERRHATQLRVVRRARHADGPVRPRVAWAGTGRRRLVALVERAFVDPVRPGEGTARAPAELRRAARCDPASHHRPVHDERRAPRYLRRHEAGRQRGALRPESALRPAERAGDRGERLLRPGEPRRQRRSPRARPHASLVDVASRRHKIAALYVPPALTPLQRRLVLLFSIAVALTRLLAVAHSLFDWDEALFALGVREYDVSQHHPHPPGYPLFVAAAKAVHLLGVEPFRSVQVVVLLGAFFVFPALFWLARELGFDVTTAF